ncbi:MAG: hypothetical protein ACN6NI_06395 [Acinetobacter sp.]
MTQIKNIFKFRKSYLAMTISLSLLSSAHAMQELSDSSLSDTTGEGVALLPESFKMVFQMPDDNSQSSSYNRALPNDIQASQYDTGFIRIIPVGENYANLTSLSDTQLSNRRTKADIFLYGLALSETNSNANQRFSNVGFNWGSEVNPWVVRAGIADSISQFNATNLGDISFFAIEAPLAREGVHEADNNIKLGLWLDAFSRTLGSSRAVNAITGAPSVVGDLTADQRVRLQLVGNGLSLSGSQVRLFQTQTSSVAQQNNTLGMASLLRINTNDDPANLAFADNATNKAALDAKVLRISTAATNDGTASTPALDRSFAPIFDASEGLYLYSPNINLVLGNMYQPFVVGSEGNNIVLEVTRIPNVERIYSKIYTDYNNSASREATLCNVESCGINKTTINGATYQGNTATHSSIAIGSVNVVNNMLEAKKTADATGVVFRTAGTNSTAVNLGSVAIDGVLIQHLKFKTTGL